MDLTLTTSKVSGRAVVSVEGEVDVYSAPQLRDRLAELLASGERDLVVDLSGVRFLDSTGIGTLVAALNGAAEVGGTLCLVCDQDRILKLFRITGLDAAFTIFPTVDAAAAQG